MNSIVKTFHQMWRKKPLFSFAVFNVVTKGPTKRSGSVQVKESGLKRILDKFKSVFKLELPD